MAEVPERYARLTSLPLVGGGIAPGGAPWQLRAEIAENKLWRYYEQRHDDGKSGSGGGGPTQLSTEDFVVNASHGLTSEPFVVFGQASDAIWRVFSTPPAQQWLMLRLSDAVLLYVAWFAPLHDHTHVEFRAIDVGGSTRATAEWPSATSRGPGPG